MTFPLLQFVPVKVHLPQGPDCRCGGGQGKEERLGGPLDRQSTDEFRHSDRGQSLRLVLNADYNLHSSGGEKIKIKA